MAGAEGEGITEGTTATETMTGNYFFVYELFNYFSILTFFYFIFQGLPRQENQKQVPFVLKASV